MRIQLKLLQKPRLGFGGTCGASERGLEWNLRGVRGQDQISRVLELEKQSLDASLRAIWSPQRDAV